MPEHLLFFCLGAQKFGIITVPYFLFGISTVLYFLFGISIVPYFFSVRLAPRHIFQFGGLALCRISSVWD